MNSAERRILELRASEWREFRAHGREALSSFKAGLRQHRVLTAGAAVLLGAGAFALFRFRRKSGEAKRRQNRLDRIHAQTAATERASRHSFANAVKRAVGSWIVHGLASPFLGKKKHTY
jgi:hypothetical protein